MQQLHLQHLEKKYKRNTVFQDINLQLTPGMFGLLGPNGAGKTTLMHIVAAIIRPTQGEIRYHGLTWSTQPEQVREITGYLPQEFNVMPHFTALECMDYIAQLKGIGNKKIRRAEIAHLLERVNLQDQAARKVKTFSGGMRRRLGIAQALLGNPQILIIDEPTAGLDPEERIRFRNMIRELAWYRDIIDPHCRGYLFDLSFCCYPVSRNIKNICALGTTGCAGPGAGVVLDIKSS